MPRPSTRAARRMVRGTGPVGMTVRELRAEPGWSHHGSASGALSRLHEAGDLEMLAERRNGCHVYVTPPFVRGRATKPHGGQLKALRAEIEALREEVARLKNPKPKRVRPRVRQ